MNPDIHEFIHPHHLAVFMAASREFNCHILIRKTGRASIEWVGKSGYTGKRGDLKAKTANLEVAGHAVAGLVCSPLLQPLAFTEDRLASARKEWMKCSHLITEPANGFDDDRPPQGCPTPYILQTKRNHRHYGCVALVDMGLLTPRYVHGDYDLYAIIPANQPFRPETIQPRHLTMGSTMTPASQTLMERLRLQSPNLEGPLSFQISNYVNTRISGLGVDLLCALMVNHGEQVNIGEPGCTFEPVLAIMPAPRDGSCTIILGNRAEHERFYQNA